MSFFEGLEKKVDNEFYIISAYVAHLIKNLSHWDCSLSRMLNYEVQTSLVFQDFVTTNEKTVITFKQTQLVKLF